MLFAMRHGQRIVTDTSALESNVARSKSGETVTIAAALGSSAPEAKLESAAPSAATFGYFFPDAPGDGRPDLVNALSHVASAMIDAEVGADGEDASGNSNIPPIFTYFGQFIDHDVTANTDRTVVGAGGVPLSTVTGPSINPVTRDEVTAGIMNLRKGSLQLDSVYGDGPVETAFTNKIKAALRDPDDRARMRTGLNLQGPTEVIPVPNGKGDLPRLGDVLDDPASGFSEADIDALLDPDLKAVFKDGSGVKRANAVVGDGRNDENLIVAQLHLAFLHLHNAVADDLKASIPDAELRFDEARRRTTMIYQWLVVNAYLPAVCDPVVVNAVKAASAQLYHAFRSRVAPGGPELPLPLEFSVAAFRFGHSMVRGAYDHNRNFGRPARPSGATFEELFSFTGGGKLGEKIVGRPLERLAANWPIEWDRFISATPAFPDRLARRIDTHLAHPLSVMLNEGDSEPDAALKLILKQLAERNMRRGYRLNIPTGQAAVAALNVFDGASVAQVSETANGDSWQMTAGIAQPMGSYGGTGETANGIEPLSHDELTRGTTGQALLDAGLADETPLWFYVLKEAEERAGGAHLGPLGSRIVAETLVGLIAEDPDSYWHQDSEPGAWTPASVPVAGRTIDSMEAMLRAGGLIS